MSEKIVCGGFEFERYGAYILSITGERHHFVIIIDSDEDLLNVVAGDGMAIPFYPSAESIKETGLPGCAKITKVKRVLGKDDVGKWFKVKNQGDDVCILKCLFRDEEFILCANGFMTSNEFMLSGLTEIICEMVEGEKW